MATSRRIEIYKIDAIPQISMNVQQQLTTVMEWPTVTTTKVPSHAAAGRVTLVMG